MSRYLIDLHWLLEPGSQTIVYDVEAEDARDALETARRGAISDLASSRYNDTPDSCGNCQTTDQNGSGICIDCGGDEWIPGENAEDMMEGDFGTSWSLSDPVDAEPVAEDAPLESWPIILAEDGRFHAVNTTSEMMTGASVSPRLARESKISPDAMRDNFQRYFSATSVGPSLF